jgi:hypothetical protein
MEYTVEVCDKCGSRTSNLDRLINEAGKTLPEGYELYDFGGGNIVAPMPSLNGDYRTSHLIAVDRTEHSGFVTGIEIRFKNLTLEYLKEKLKIAVDYNRTQTKQIFEFVPTQETQSCQ